MRAHICTHCGFFIKMLNKQKNKELCGNPAITKEPISVACIEQVDCTEYFKILSSITGHFNWEAPYEPLKWEYPDEFNKWAELARSRPVHTSTKCNTVEKKADNHKRHLRQVASISTRAKGTTILTDALPKKHSVQQKESRRK